MLNRWAQACCAYRGSILSFHRSAGLSLKRFFLMGARLAPNRKKRSIVPVSAPPRAPAAPGCACWGGGGLSFVRYRPLLPSRRGPPYQCLSVRRLVSGTACSPAAAVPHPVSAFVRSQSPPGEAAGGTVCSFPTAPPRPISALSCVVLLAVPSAPALLPRPPDQCFRSVSFRRPMAVEDSDRCARKSRTTLGIVIRGRRRASCPGGTVDH